MSYILPEHKLHPGFFSFAILRAFLEISTPVMFGKSRELITNPSPQPISIT